MPQASKASSNTYMPSRSQASIRAAEGGLWVVRMALKPTDLSSFTFRTSASYRLTAPITPLSWCRQPPFSFTVLPLILRPCFTSASTVRMPNSTPSSSTVPFSMGNTRVL